MRPEHEALIHGAIDGTLSADERETLRLLLENDSDVRERAAELDQVNTALASLGPAEAPADLVGAVMARLTVSSPPRTAAAPQPVYQFVRRSVPKRGVTVNKKMIFALAAAAVVVLAMITYTSYPPATTGTEATIGAAQRAQTPQIAPADVKLADQSAQELLQSDTWDAIMNDPDLHASLQDAELRKVLEDADLRKAIEDDAVRRSLTDAELARTVKMLATSRSRSLSEAELRGVKSAQARVALQNEAFARALRNNANLARFLMDARVAKALSSEAMARVVRDAKFEAALKNARFGEALARAKK